MPALLLILKAYKLKRALKRLTRAKENALRAHHGQRPKYPWYEECFSWSVDCMRNFFCSTFCHCCVHGNKQGPEGYSENFLRRPCLVGSFENYTLKSLLGFAGGLLLTLLLFWFLVRQLSMHPGATTLLCCVVGVALTQALAFSTGTRCLVLLVMPSLFSSRGRMALLAYTYIVVMSGPAKNALRNANVLVYSLNCGQEVLVKQTKAILKSIFEPLIAVVDVMRDILKALKEFARMLKNAFLAIRDLFLEIINAIKVLFEWLLSAVNVCSSKYGSPYERCNRAFESAIEDCVAKMGVFNFLCHIVSGIKYICEISRIVDLLCKIPKAIKTGIIEPLKELKVILMNVVVLEQHYRLLPTDRDQSLKGNICEQQLDFRTFARYMYFQFYVNVTFVHYYNYSLEQSKSFSDIRGDIGEEIRQRTDWVISLIDWSDLSMLLFFFLLLFKAYVYRIRYLTADHFDNVYVTFHVMDLNERRTSLGKETVLPLTFREQRKYVHTFSYRMAASERTQLRHALGLLLVSGLQMAFYVLVDCSLYHFLLMVRSFGLVATRGQLPDVVQVKVKGEGVMADMYRQMLGQFDPLMKSTPAFDLASCLPDPVPTDIDKYQRIGLLYLACIFLALTESYGLRLRHVVCGCYYPAREKLRAVWLYNRILRTRGGLRRFLRRAIRRKLYGDDTSGEKISWIGRLAAQSSWFAWVVKMMGYLKIYCICCNEPGDPDDSENFKHCGNFGCKGVYCRPCFDDIRNLCTLCMKPVEYGDLSDFSEERDSSEDGESIEDENSAPRDGPTDKATESNRKLATMDHLSDVP